jgi:hypothetical protein
MIDASQYLGVPRGFSGTDAWQGIEEETGPLSVEYKEFCSQYGPGIVCDFLTLFHPGSTQANMQAISASMAPFYQELHPGRIPYAVYPEDPDGIVQWASSVDADAFFLIPRSFETWGVGVWFRQWGEWEEYDVSVPEWLISQISGDLIIPGLPMQENLGFKPLS